MSYTPYVTGNNPQKKNSAYGSAGTTGMQSDNNTNTNPYGAPSIRKTTNNPYGSPPTTPAASSSYNPYQNVSMGSTMTTNTSSNPYGAVPSAPSASNYNYNPYENVPKPMTTTTPSSNGNPYGARPSSNSATTANPTLPDFSKALDAPPPTNPASSHGYANSTSNYNSDSSDVVATAFPVSHIGHGRAKPGMSLVNSMTYQGGPTNGLVSEGDPVKCNKVDYEIKGYEMQLVEIELDPNEAVIGEAGGMMFMEDGIKFEAKFGDGSTPQQGFWKKLLAAGGRLLTGESLFVTHFTNEGPTRSRVAFAAPYPGNILPLDLTHLGGSITCQRDAFLCAALGTKVSMTFNKRIGSGLFGGEGFILQKLEGDGMCFIHAGGTIIRRELRNERIRLDTGCLVAFTTGIDFEIQFSPGLKTALFGGEGLFLAVLKGTGTVYLQSLPFSRMADRIIQSAPSAGGRRVGEGSALTGRFGDLVNGDGF